MAKRLKEAGFPQPENLTINQMWFNEHENKILITKNADPFELATKIPIHPTENREGIYFAPTVEDIVTEMPEWGISLEGNKVIVHSDKSQNTYTGSSELEAWAKAWIGQNAVNQDADQ